MPSGPNGLRYGTVLIVLGSFWEDVYLSDLGDGSSNGEDTQSDQIGIDSQDSRDCNTASVELVIPSLERSCPSQSQG